MEDFENRINTAAAELRESTKLLTPPPIRKPVVGRGVRWTAFAVGVGMALVAVTAIPGLLESFQPGVVGSPGDTSTTIAPPPTSTPPPQCSSAGHPAPGPQQGLPPQVAATRMEIVEAALACDFDTLEAIAATGFRTDFGGGGVEMFRRWEDSGEGKLGTLLLLLDMSWGIQEVSEPGIHDHYAWPRAFVYDMWDDIPTAELDELLAIYTREEVDELAGFGSYAGWRTGIDADGEWRFFIAGD